jgi:hypothetical protein
VLPTTVVVVDVVTDQFSGTIRYVGVYVDIRCKPLCKLSKVIQRKDELIIPIDTLSTFLWQGFLCAKPRHPVIKILIDKVCKMIEERDYGDNPLDITGPSIFGKVLNEYIGNNNKYNRFSEKCFKKIRILNTRKGYVTYRNKDIITRYITDEKLFAKLTGKEKYGTSWIKRRVFKLN